MHDKLIPEEFATLIPSGRGFTTSRFSSASRLFFALSSFILIATRLSFFDCSRRTWSLSFRFALIWNHQRSFLESLGNTRFDIFQRETFPGGIFDNPTIFPTAIMADQLSSGMANLGLDSGPPGGQQPRSYIPPHMRGKLGPANGAPAGPPPMGGGGPGMNGGLNNSAWAG